MAGEYTPKFKVGQSISIIRTDNRNRIDDGCYIVVSTHRGFGQFNRDFRDRSDYDERDAEHTLYALFGIEYNSAMWMWEKFMSLYCCNSNRGKKLLLMPDTIKCISNTYSIVNDGLLKYIDMLKDQPSDAS